MLPRWLFVVNLFCSFTTAAVTCSAELGNAIRGADCGWALGILQTRLTLLDPQNQNLEHAQQTFMLNSNGDPRYKMPQGASFGTCGIGIDIAPALRSVGSWGSLIVGVEAILAICSGQRLGGMNQLGQFNILIVDAGQGMRNLVGTCMSPTPAPGLPLLWQMKERFCGFPTVAALLRPPDVSQLPVPPPSLFPLGLALNVVNGVPYRVRGQWIWNTDTWSPIIGNALNQAAPRAIWVLVAGGGPGQAGPNPPPFSRTIPRVMGSAWFGRLNQPPRRILGAWGAHGGNWMPLTGDLANLQPLIDSFHWLLVELESSNQAAADTAIPSFGPLQSSGTYYPGSGAFYPGLGQGQSSNPRLGQSSNPRLGQSFNPRLGQGRTFHAGLVPRPGQRRNAVAQVPRIGQAWSPANTRQTATATVYRPATIASAEGTRQSIRVADLAADAFSDNPSTSTASNDDDFARLSKRPRPAI